MPISADCPQCGKTYRVKDDFAGKKFRCKQCQGVVSVPAAKAASGDPWDDLDLGEFQDQGAFGDDEFGAPPAAPRKRPAGKKKSKARSSGEMPVTIMVAIGCEAVLILAYVLNLIISMIAEDTLTGVHFIVGGCAVLLVCTVDGGAAFGYFKRMNVMRWISVVLTSITFLTCFGCGIMALVMPAVLADNMPPGHEMEAGEMMVDGIILIATSIVRGTLLVCLLLPASSAWFDA